MLDAATVSRLSPILPDILNQAQFFKLPITHRKHAELAAMLNGPALSLLVQLKISDVRTTMVQELGARLFFPASQDMVEYLDKEAPFGKQTSEAFPLCVEDISEAHQCFAFRRYTAAMFHLGRAMELAVRQLAKRMRAKVARDDWQSYINAMNHVINEMPFKKPREKAKRALFSETTNYLFNFKEAWRNPTMHPEKTYTRQQALDVLNNSRAFFQYVSEKIFGR